MQTEFLSEMGGILLLDQNQSVADGSSARRSFVLITLNNFVLIAWSFNAGDASFKCLLYQLSSVGSAPTIVVTGNQGSIPEREPEKQLPHPRKAANDELLEELSWEVPSDRRRIIIVKCLILFIHTYNVLFYSIILFFLPV